MNAIAVAICTDCLMWAANADCSGMPDHDCETDPTHLQPGIGPGWYLVPGSDHSDCTHDRDEDCPEDEGWFSWSWCDACQRPLGGDRYPAMMLQVTS